MRRELEDRLFWQERLDGLTLRVVGLGAPAKATVWLNYMGFTQADVDYVVDSTPEKQGRWIPGVAIPIYPREMMLMRSPDLILVFAHNYVDEIVKWAIPYNPLMAPMFNVATRERVA